MSFTDLSLYDCWRCGEYGHDRSRLVQSDVGGSSSYGLLDWNCDFVGEKTEIDGIFWYNGVRFVGFD